MEVPIKYLGVERRWNKFTPSSSLLRNPLLHPMNLNAYPFIPSSVT
jgi:hypothetical protein